MNRYEVVLQRTVIVYASNVESAGRKAELFQPTMRIITVKLIGQIEEEPMPEIIDIAPSREARKG